MNCFARVKNQAAANFHLLEKTEIVRARGHPPIQVPRVRAEHLEGGQIRVQPQPPVLALPPLGVLHDGYPSTALELWHDAIQINHQLISHWHVVRHVFAFSVKSTLGYQQDSAIAAAAAASAEAAAAEAAAAAIVAVVAVLWLLSPSCYPSQRIDFAAAAASLQR